MNEITQIVEYRVFKILLYKNLAKKETEVAIISMLFLNKNLHIIIKRMLHTDERVELYFIMRGEIVSIAVSLDTMIITIIIDLYILKLYSAINKYYMYYALENKN